MDKKECIIIVPIYKKELSKSEKNCLENYIKKLLNFKFYFIAPADLDESYYSGKWSEVPVIRFEEWNSGNLGDYNRLLMSSEFYAQFSEYKYMLILQLDGWLLKGEAELNYFLQMEYDYIGAPWPDGGFRYYKRIVRGANHIKLLRSFTGETVCKVGNGGVSLRKTEKMEVFFKKYKKEKTNWNNAEDIFISYYGQKRKCRLRIPSVETAKQFSLERDMKKEILKGNIPMAVHKWEKYCPELFSIIK